jgi:non-heme chloroperoxidase
VRFWDGTETLSYSYRLTASFHPRNRYVSDVRKLAAGAVVLLGVDDEGVDAQRQRKVFDRESPATQFNILSHTNHFGIFTSDRPLKIMIGWLTGVDIHPAVKTGKTVDLV